MKAITLWQPWATFIALGWKMIETRTHKRFFNLLNQTIGIHAGKYWDAGWRELTTPYLDLDKLMMIEEMKTSKQIPFSRIICTAKVYKVGYLTLEHSQDALIDCGFSYVERTGLFLSDVKELTPTFEVKGHQGIFNVELPKGVL